jgi:hypothetical protein
MPGALLELLANENGLYGYHVHFSNGNKATYTRSEKGTEVINHHWNRDGTINFFVGSLDALEKVWKIDGVPVDEFNKGTASSLGRNPPPPRF